MPKAKPKPKRKTVHMIVTITCPAWLTESQARREVRSLINDQCFHGHRSPVDFEEVGDDNFRARSVGRFFL